MIDYAVKVRSTCRVCDGDLLPVLDLGAHYLSDFLKPGQAPPYPKVPLVLMRCERCTLVQLQHTTPPAWMYREYWYRSSVNETMIAALNDVAQKAVNFVGPETLSEDDVVVDIGANDGTLLRHYYRVAPHVTRVAYEPALNLNDTLRAHAEIVIADFFSAKTYPFAPHTAKIISSCAMFYDLEDPNAFVADIATILHPQGVWVVQMSSLEGMLRTNDIGNLCHEHLEVYSLEAFMTLVQRHGLDVVDVEENDVNGGSFRAYVRHPTALRHTEWDRHVDAYLAKEAALKLDTDEPYQRFAYRVEELKKHVVAIAEETLRQGGTVDLYGASTKAGTILQYFGLDHRSIRQAIERSPQKFGLEMVAGRIPIVSEDVGRAEPASLWLCPIWHFKKSVIAREAEYLSAGGVILFPLPHAEIVIGRQV